jgi:hypothetical protein
MELRQRYELLKRSIQKLAVQYPDEELLADQYTQSRHALNEIFAYQLNKAIRIRMEKTDEEKEKD